MHVEVKDSAKSWPQKVSEVRADLEDHLSWGETLKTTISWNKIRLGCVHSTPILTGHHLYIFWTLCLCGILSFVKATMQSLP